MAYKYQLNVDGSSSKGYVKFNTSPDIASTVFMYGDTITVTGEAKYSQGNVTALAFSAVSGENTEIAVSKRSGQVFTFTMIVNVRRPSNRIYKQHALFYFKDDDGEGFYTQTDSTSFEVTTLRYRLPPEISGTFEDLSGAHSIAGSYLQGVSNLKFTSEDITDPADTSVSIAFRTLKINGVEYAMDSNSIDIGILNYYETVSYSYTATDSKGMSSTITGYLDFVPYSEPVASAYTVERYAEVTTQTGEIEYELSDDSPKVWLNLSARVKAVNGLNSYTAVVSCGSFSKTVGAGEDGGVIEKVKDRTMTSMEFSEEEAWTFVLTITDRFKTVTYNCIVPKSGGIFNIERTGVAVGKRSSGTLTEPKFEVAYPAYFLNHMYGMDGNEIGSIEYSTTPKACGTWIDGSIVYRVVLALSRRTSTGTYYVDLPVSVSRVINMYGSVTDNGGQQHPVNSHYSTEYRFYCRLYSATQFICVNGRTFADGYIVLEYLPT